MQARAPRVFLAVPLFLAGVLLVLVWRWFVYERHPEPVETLAPGDRAAGPAADLPPGSLASSASRIDPGRPSKTGTGARGPRLPALAWPPKKSSRDRASGPSKVLLSPRSFTEPVGEGEPVPAGKKSGPASGKKAGARPAPADSRSVLAGLPKRSSAPAGFPSVADMSGVGRRYAEFQDALAAYRRGTALSDRQRRVLRDAEAESAREAERIIRQAIATQPVEDAPSGPLARGKTWPVDGRVTQEFGPNDFSLNGPHTYNGKYYPHFHTGMDIAAPMDAPIRALDAGRVAHVGHSPGLGMHVIVVHAGGLATTYGHMDTGSRGPRVRTGDRVAAGQVLGYIGMTGVTTGPHTHFMTHKGDLVNPRRVLP